MDARDLKLDGLTFRTVFANCVLEHVPGVDKVLSMLISVLETGGRIVATVPFVEMNRSC